MNSFLEKVTAHVLEKYSGSFETLCIVAPNRRAGLFLRNHFSKRIEKPSWSPTFMSIEDFANKISGLEVVDSLGLVFQFWKTYQTAEGDSGTTLEEFLHWAPMLLRDFDEIDAALDNPSQLFSYLNDLKYIATWNPDGTPLTEFQKRYLAFFQKLGSWHEEFKQKLTRNNLAYQGMSFRKAARMVQEGAQFDWFENAVFAGFNALNNAEEIIISSLLKCGAAEVIFDSDPYYEDNPVHEAGHFVRKYKRKWSIPKQEGSESFYAAPKSIKVLGIPGSFNQSQLVGNLLAQDYHLTANERTAIVLANENLLVPVLNALPPKIDSINVTMGYPLAQTNLFSFIQSLVQLFITRHRIRLGGNGTPRGFYHKDLVRFLSNSCIDVLTAPKEKPLVAERVIAAIAKSNQTFYTFEQLDAIAGSELLFSKNFHFLSENWDQNPWQVLSGLALVCERLDRKFRQNAIENDLQIQQTPYFVDFEALYYFLQILKRVGLVLPEDSKSGLNIEIIWRVIVQACKETRLALSGEPVAGLQIMGVLETRNLDFENVVMVSVNESTLPKGKQTSSFIPYEVRRKFGLQVHTEKDAIYSYHFYRLLQRAKNVFLIYNTQSGNMGSNEQSRFITQLQHELPKFNPEIFVISNIVTLPLNLKTEVKTITIQKTPEIETRLLQIAEMGFSPSSLNAYIRCPLRFYMERVAGVSAADQVEETLEPSTIGTIVHRVLEDFFKPFKGKVISANDVDKMLADLPQSAIKRFETEYPDGDISGGKNLLLFELAKKQLERFLYREKSFIEKCNSNNQHLTILETEKKLESYVWVEVNGIPHEVKIGGVADRVDVVGGLVRVIDYKTGKVEAKELVVNNIDELTTNPKYDKAFQLLAYNWMYSKSNPGCKAIQPEIFSLRNQKDTLTVSVKGDDGNEILDRSGLFETKLKELLSEILNPALPFVQADNVDNCKYCQNQAMCGRFIDPSGF